MNKLLILALFFACFVLITEGLDNVKETNVAQINTDIAASRDVRDAESKNNNKKKAKKSKNKNRVKNRRSGKKARKERKNRKAKKENRKEGKRKMNSRKGKKFKKGKKGSRTKKARKSKKNTKRKKSGHKTKKGNKAKKSKKRKTSKKTYGKRKTKKAKKTKKSRKGRKNRGNKRKSGKGRKMKESRQETSSCMNETCINTAMSYMKIMKDKVSNFLRQKTRIGKYQTTSGNKAGKKGLFGPILNRIREAGGGNSSNLKCNGDSSGAGAKQMKNLTSLLGACEENINASCNANLPAINKTEHDLCETAMTAFADLTKACQKKTGAEACACWTNSTLESSVTAVKNCDIREDNKKMTEAKKECTTAFGKCRKIEDSVSLCLSACSPANTKSRATADIKQGLKNKAAKEKATAKINATASNSTARQSGGIACSVFISDIKSATAEILRAPLLSGTETKLLALVSAVVLTCKSEEKTMLLSLSVEMDRTAENIDLNIESKQTDLLISQGATLSTSIIQATIDAEASATAAPTAAGTPASTKNTMSTKAPSLRRRMFNAAHLKI